MAGSLVFIFFIPKTEREYLHKLIELNLAVAILIDFADHGIKFFLVGFETKRLHQRAELLRRDCASLVLIHLWS